MSFLLVTGCVLSSIAGYAYHSLNQGRLTDAQTRLIKEKSDFSNIIQFIFESALKDIGLDDNCKIKLFITDKDNPSNFFGNVFSAYSFGNVFSKERGIVISLSFCNETSDEHISFIFKHEIAHIQKNHLLKIPFYSFLAGSIPLVASYIYSINPATSVAISALSTLATIFLYTRFSESEANAIAAEYSSDKELQSTIDEYIRMRECVSLARKCYKDIGNWRYHLYLENGDCLMDFLHPSMTTEQALLEKKLRERLLCEQGHSGINMAG